MITVTNLLCHRDIDLALLSLKSFIHNCKDEYKIKIYEDGSLTEKDRSLITNEFVGIEVMDKKGVDEQVKEVLKNYPFCRQFRDQSPFTIKLFDMAIVEQDDYLYFDSDVFFIKPFKGFDRRKFGNESLILMNDRFDYYSVNYFNRYIHPRFKTPNKINAGFYYLKNGSLDLDLFEWFLSKREIFQNTKEFWRVVLAEQTAWALLAGKTNGRIWKKSQAVIPASMDEVNSDVIVVHLIKQFRHLLEPVKPMMFSNHKETIEIETEELAYSNLISAVLDRMKFKLSRNK